MHIDLVHTFGTVQSLLILCAHAPSIHPLVLLCQACCYFSRECDDVDAAAATVLMRLMLWLLLLLMATNHLTLAHIVVKLIKTNNNNSSNHNISIHYHML